MDCLLSLEPGGSNTQAVLQWLLNYAVSLEYADAGVCVALAGAVSNSTSSKVHAEGGQQAALQGMLLA